MHLTTLALIASSLVGLGQSFNLQGFDLDGAAEWADWEEARKDGARFVTARATSGDTKIDEDFEENWSDAEENEFIRAAYHQGKPGLTSGQAQAEFFLGHGGKWINDNMTLPGILEIRAADAADQCYGLNPNETLQFMDDFASTYHEATNRKPFLRANLSWFDNCTDHAGWPPNLYMAMFYEGSHPIPDRDLELTYGTSWVLWSNDKEYPPGGYSDVFNGGDLEYLREYAQPGDW